MKMYTPPRDASHSARRPGNSPDDRVAYTKNGWEHFSHGSDIGVRGIGNTLEEAFEQAAVALTAVVADVCSVHEKEIVEGIENDTLFDVMKEHIEEGRALFKSRVTPEIYELNLYDRAIVDVMIKSKGHVKSKIW